MKRILKLYSPYALQRAFHAAAWKTRFFVAAWGRQMGKSTAALNHLLKCAWERAGTRYWFVAPTHAQALVQYRRLVGMLFFSGVLMKKNQTELRCKLINFSEIKFVSGKNFNNLRSETLDGAVIDEVRDQHPDLWPMVIRSMLTKRRGFCIFISTPNGFDPFWELFERARGDKRGVWGSLHAPASQCPFYGPGELDLLRDEMTPAQYAQEIEAQFLNLTQSSVYTQFHDGNLLDHSPWMPSKEWAESLPVVLGSDFNLNPMAWCLGQIHERRMHFGRELWIPNTYTQQAATALVDVLDEELPFAKKTGIQLVADASGKAGKTSSGTETDIQIILQTVRAAGYPISNRTPEANPKVRDRVNTVNAALRSASGAVRVTFNEKKCPKTVEDHRRVQWKEKQEGYILDEGPKRLFTHPSDATGYPICQFLPLRGPAVVNQRVIVR